MSFSIRQAAHTCLQNLGHALSSHGHDAPACQRTWVQRRIVDFNTWATFSGVFREGMYGLDAKLCLRPDLQAGLISLLQVFDALLSPMVERSGSWRTREIDDKFSEIVSMTVYLRKSLANTGLWPERDSAQVAMGVLKAVKPHLAQSIPGNPNTVSEGVPIQDQRGIIQNLRNRLDNASSTRERLFAAKEQQGRDMANTESQHTWPPPKTNQFPPVPLVGAKNTSFVCQFCCRDLPAFFSDAHAWREHFLQDLSPYTCVLPNCPQPHSVYGTQRDWETHMKLVAHDGFEGRSWSCKVCLADFKSMDKLLRHLRVNHVDASTNDADAQLPAEFKSCIKLDLSHLRVCFLCNEDVSGASILDHIASCMEIFALKSLKRQSMTPPAISIQIEEANIPSTGAPSRSSQISSDRDRLLVPTRFGERSSRRANSLPEHNAEPPEFRVASKRRSMVEHSDHELTQESEPGLRWLEIRSGVSSISGSTDGERRSAKIRRLSNSSSIGSATMLERPRRKASPSKSFPNRGAALERSPMLQRYLDNLDRHEFIGRRRRNISVG